VTVAGTIAATIALAALVLGVRRRSAVVQRLALIAPAPASPHVGLRGVSDIDLRHAGVGLDSDRFLAVRVAGGCVFAGGAVLGSLAWGLGVAPIPVAAYAGAMLPALIVESRARARRDQAERATGALVERLDALVAAGRPAETALGLLMRRLTGSPVLDATLRRASQAQLLGAPVFRTLAAHAREDRLVACAALGEDLERSRGLGAGSLAAIRERERAIRAEQRTRSLEAASQVEGKLMLILVLCYLPALVLLVVIPLFVGLLEGLFA
jgi:hypothetical protein